jgi:hypothetical protein
MSTPHGSALQAANLTQRMGLAGLACLIIAFWMIIHPYRGIDHDSVLYSLLALARLHPAALGHDLFVRYGTQDNFTIFGPMFAAAIRAMGLEPAAAIMTFATQIAFFGAAWLLARRLMPPAVALLGVGLLVVLPSWYGSHSVFEYVEAFLTPRQSAEAFALAGLAAAVHSRQILAAVCMAVAMLLHPIIAAAGVVGWIVLVPGLAHPRVSIAATAAVAVALVALSAIGIGPFRHFDDAWLTVLRDRLAYLFPTEWSATEWISIEAHGAILAAGIAFSRNDHIRRLCMATLITVFLGMLFALVESDGLRVILAAQLQTWRWLWLLGAMSILLLPMVAIDCWRSGDLGRATALLVLAALLMRTNEIAAVPASLACLAVLGSVTLRDPLAARALLVAAVALLVLSLVVVAQDIYKLLPTLDATREPTRYLVRMAQVQALAYGGLLPAAALALVCFSVSRATRRNAMLLAALGAVLLLAMLPYSILTWTHAKFPQDRVQAFAPWRQVIPESAEVLWPESPQAEWFELGRSSYWSLYQMAGMVFSRDVTMVSTSRETAVSPMLAQLKNPPAPPTAAGPCSVTGVDFYTSWADLGPTPYPPVAPEAEHPHEMLYLYHCGENRH